MVLKIHPGIGVARVGDSPEHFIGPETVDLPSAPSGGYRDTEGRIRRQAARFRVFDDATPVTLSGGTTIEWTVTLSGGTASIGGVSQSVSITSSGATVAELRTDADGNLLVLSPEITGSAGGCSEGPVQATVTSSGVGVAAQPSWVGVAPPDFAPARRPKLPYSYMVLDWLVGEGLLSPPAAATSISFRREIYPAIRGRTSLEPAELLALSTPAERAAAVSSSLPPGSASIGPYAQAMVDHFTTGTFVDDWATPVPLEPAELDRGPLSFVDASCFGPGWELRILPLPSGAIAAGETLRFNATVVAPAVLRPFYGWQGDLPACLSEWITVTDAPMGYGRDWQLRGFMLGSGNSSYEEWVSRFQLLTTALDFGEVQRGSGVARAIEIELQNYYSPAPIEFLAPLPPGVSVLRTLTSTGQTPEMSTTLELWVFFRAALDAPLGTIAPMTLELSIDGQPQSVPVTASIVAAQTTQMAVVLDCSGSMTEDRGDGVTKFAGLKAAFDVLASVARPGDGIAVAPFSDNALPGHTARSLGDGGAGDTRREAVRTFVDGLSTVNLTSIGDGILSARSLLGSSPDSFSRNALIVITDGVETAPEWIVNVSSSIREDTFAIGIGTGDNVNRDILADIAGSHRGYLLLTGDSVSGDNRYRLDKYLLQILAGATRDQVVLDPSGSVLPGAVVRIPIPVTEAEFQLDVVVVSSDAPELLLALMGPDGSVRSFEALSAEPGVQIVRRSRVALARVPTPLPLRDGRVWKEGTWQLLIAQRAHVPRDPSNDLLLTHLTQPYGAAAGKGSKAGKVMTYAAVVNARSSLELSAHAHVSEPGKPIALEATLGHCGVPLRSEVAVNARVHTPGGASFDLALTAAQPGRFLGQFEAVTPGVYPTRLRARGYSAAGHPFVRELTLTPALASRASPRNPCNPCERPRSPREKAAGLLAQLGGWIGRVR